MGIPEKYLTERCHLAATILHSWSPVVPPLKGRMASAPESMANSALLNWLCRESLCLRPPVARELCVILVLATKVFLGGFPSELSEVGERADSGPSLCRIVPWRRPEGVLVGGFVTWRFLSQVRQLPGHGCRGIGTLGIRMCSRKSV